MGVGSLSLLSSIDFLLPFQFLDNLVQLVEARVPELAISLDPGRLFLESAHAERYHQVWDSRFDELDKVVEELKRKENIDGRKKRE